MAIDSEHIVSLVNTAGRLVGLQELLRVGGLNPGEQTALKRVLRELVRDGRLVRDGKRFGPVDGKPKQKSGPAWQKEKGPPARPARTERAARPERPVREERRPAREERSVSTPSSKRHQPVAAKPTRSGPPAKQASNTVIGIIHHHRDGFAFVKPIVGQVSEDLFIPPDEARKALDHDQVRVEVLPGRDGRTMGRVLEVTSRTRQQVVGTYFENAKTAWVEPKEGELGHIRVPKTQIARPGDLVKVRLGVGDSMFAGPSQLTGEVAGSLGSNEDYSADVLAIAYSKGFHDEFPDDVMDEADAISIEVSADDAKGERRKDLRTLPLITIDGEDARDFDDAVFCEENERGWRLVVAIADVSHYVLQDQPLDAEALRRATSVYLPSRVLPMLPERLSNGICSLKPDVDRLCMVADMIIDRGGQTLDSEIYPAVMRSAARCTYTEVHDVLNGTSVPHRNHLKDHFERLLELSRTLTKMRLARGAIDFDLPEQKVELGEDGLPARLVRRERWESHRLVEECMLAANETVARFFRERGLPTVNRYHGPPDEERQDMFLTLLGAYGVTVPSGEFTSKSLNEVLKQLEGHPEQRALNQLALRSMMQAVYSSRNMGHYGLGAEDYLHFTSPIRRYPDLLVHRLLKELWKRGKKKLAQSQLDEEEERLEALSVQCSERERAAMQVEREVNQLYSCLLLKDRVGEEHPGTVAGLTDNGFYVQLEELWVEGFVRGESVFPDFEFAQSTYRLNFGNGLVVKVGLPCQVTIAGVNLERRQIDFRVEQLEGEDVEAAPEPTHRESPRGRQGGSFKGPKRGGRDRDQGERGRGDRPYRSQDRGGRFGPPPKQDSRSGGRPSSREAPRSFEKGRGRFDGNERGDSGSTRRFEKSNRFESSKPSRFGGQEKPSRFGGGGGKSSRFEPSKPSRFASGERPRQPQAQGERAQTRRPQPPPQPWQRNEESEEKDSGATSSGKAPTNSGKGFDARAVLDRLWKERGGGGGRRR